ncbi:MAG: hypothetical protein JO001_21110 [Alphaproteobacteria bacterium]|nr:hypothetical protein [Alphaproteobacteria bacterium]
MDDGLLRVPQHARGDYPRLSRLRRDGENTPQSLLDSRGWESGELLARSVTARNALVQARVGGAWWHDDPSALPVGRYAVVLPHDPPLAGSAIGTTDIAPLLNAALATASADRLVIAGAVGDTIVPPGARLVGASIDPWRLIERADAIYTTGGEIGFLALLAGIPVHAFAASHYTGWGLTRDAACVPDRRRRRSLDEVFAAICLLGTEYRDPFRDQRIAFENALTIAAEWRRAEEANKEIAVCVGMSFWKRRRIAEFLRSEAGTPRFCRGTDEAIAAAKRRPGAIAGWASRLPDGLVEAAAREGVKLVRVEDGFIRSVGLGSDFLPPASLVLDGRGMYFDPRQASDLEILLRESSFSPALIARAARLATHLVARGVTKYNLAAAGPAVELPAGRLSILVPGQVEDDLSIRLGGGTVRTNLGLLATTRAANPDAYILYKPHPDVLAGHRVGAVPEAEALRHADMIAPPVSTAALLDRIDELHTMTSLAGFEALLRGRRVTVHGRPFYAGWGLTTDTQPLDRGRRLSLEELVAGVLILYPRYLDPLTRFPCGPEIIIERLDNPELWRPGLLVMARRLQGMLARRLGEVRAMLPIPGSGPARGLRERPRS